MSAAGVETAPITLLIVDDHPVVRDGPAMRGMRALRKSTMERTFATIRRTYSSFDGFLRDGLKMTPADLKALKLRLLTD